MINKYTSILFIFLLYLFLLSGCDGEFGSIDNYSSVNNRKDLVGRVIQRDSLPEPQHYKPIIGEPIPARIINRFEVAKNHTEDFEPLRFSATPPEKRTPGQGKYQLPEKVAATPLYGTIPLPEKIKLKEPISIGDNPFSFMTHTKVQGLSHDDVMTFCEDQPGNMWIGTFGGGLMRFDGRDISWFNNTPWGELPEVIAIESDSQGRIWLATVDGLFRIDGSRMYHFDDKTGGLRDNSIESLQIDKKGNLWVSYWKGGVSMYDGTHFYHYGTDQGLSKEQGQVLKVSNSGDIWISDYQEGLFLFREGSFYVYEVPFLSYDHPVLAIGNGTGNAIWFSMYGLGVVRFDGEEFQFFTIEEGFPSPEIYQIEKDADGKVWFATWGKGLIRWDKEKFEVFSKDEGLFSHQINGIFIDRNNTLWVGFNGGIARYFGDIFKHFTTRQPFDTQTTSMALDSMGKLWISSYGGGLKSFDGEKFIHYTPNPDDPHLFMEGITSDSKGNLWMSINQQGIYRFDGSHFFHYQLDMLDKPFQLESGMEDSRGNLWLLAGKQGVLKYDGKTFKHFNQQNGMPVSHARAITEDAEGNIVIATYGGGVVIVNDHSFTCYTEKNGLASNFLFSAFKDSENNLWFGTNGKGLSMFNGKHFINFTSSKGLTDNYIFSIAQDSGGNMIFGGRFGLNVMPYNTLKDITEQSEPGMHPNMDNHYFVKHTYEEGFLGIGSNLGMMLENEGNIWIGTNNRITRFNSRRSIIDPPAPNVVISEIDLFNEKLNWQELANQQDTFMLLANGVKLKNFSFDSLSPWYYVPENLHLSHKNNFITFHFSGISTSSGNKLLYSYKLEGFDKQWHRPAPENYAHFGNLPSGEYTLKVKALNKAGIWSKEEQLTLVILTPWYKKWWAFLLYFIVAAAVLWLYIRVREKSLVLENKLLDNEVELARKTIEIKQNIIANVSHELRTPLTGIIGLADILAKTPLNEQQKEYILTLQQTGSNLKEIINQILDYSKIESGEVSLSITAFSIRELFMQAEKVFDSLKHNQSEVFIKTHIEEKVPSMLLTDRGRVNQILLNLLYNAVKFTPKGSITLEACVEKTIQASDSSDSGKTQLLIKISVIDTGVGISGEAIKKLFLPFSQIENNDTRETDSTGLGLAISKKLAHLLKGNIGVESKPGKGSRFWFTFLAEQPEHFTPEITSTRKETAPETESKKILLVEDKKVNQLVIKLLLKGMGHEVEIAENGEIALKLYQPEKYDFILMDIQMPVMDGITATQKLKEKYSDLPPIIGLSANAFEGDREKYMGLGMDEYITKPVNEDSLRKVLAHMDSKN